MDNETASVHLEGKLFLEGLRCTILSVTFDGFKANIKVFQGISRQIRLFHVKRMVVRGTTLRPKTEAGRALLALTRALIRTDKDLFTERLRKFHSPRISFLEEKTRHPDGSWSYTHEGVRKAYFSVLNWYDYLFTFHSDRKIPPHHQHLRRALLAHQGHTFHPSRHGSPAQEKSVLSDSLGINHRSFFQEKK